MGKAHAEGDILSWDIKDDQAECVSGEFGVCVNAFIPVDTE